MAQPSKIRQINVNEARQLHDAGKCLFVDIRDPDSHAEARIAGSVRLGDDNLRQFLRDTAREESLVVYCYHGNSSLAAAQVLADKGFTDVVSMAGGFEEWALFHPFEEE